MIGAFLTFAVSIFLALLPGCAAPTTYGDGAPMRAPVVEPRPGYAPAGAGLPGYWGSPEPEAIPRSPHKRVLPPQAGPGIWAGDEPKASVAPWPIVIDGIPLLLPDEAEGHARTAACADAVRAALLDSKGSTYLARALPDMKTCGVFLAWRHCMLSSLWTDGPEEAARIVAKADAAMMADKTPSRCWTWMDAFKPDLEGAFDWFLRGWYFRTQKPRSQ